MSEFAGDEAALLPRASSRSDSDFIANRPQFGPKGGVEPPPRTRVVAPRVSRNQIQKDMIARGRATARKAGATGDDHDSDKRAIMAMSPADLAVFDNGFMMDEQRGLLKQLGKRDARTLPATGASVDMRSAAEPIAEDRAGERQDDDTLFATNMAAYRKHAADRRFGEWKSDARSGREQRASQFSWLSPSTWGMFKGFDWAKRANAKRQVAELEESMGGKAPKQGPWRGKRYTPGATDANLFGDNAYSLSKSEFNAWTKAVPSATRYENATNAGQQAAGRQGIMDAAASEGVDGGELGRLALGAAVKSPEEKAAEAARMQRAIARDPRGEFNYTDGQVVDGHALLGAPTKNEDTPDIIKDVFGMGGAAPSAPATSETAPASSDNDSDDGADDAPEAPAPGAFQLRRAGRIA